MGTISTRIPWNEKIREKVKTLIEQAGTLSGLPIIVHHAPTGEELLSSIAMKQEISELPMERVDVQIGSSLVLVIKSFSSKGKDDPTLQAVLQMLHVCVKELLQSQAEIQSFSEETLESYQTINMFYRISEALGNIQEVDHVSSIILDEAVAITKAERGSVLLLNRDQKTFNVSASYGLSQEKIEELRTTALKFSETLCSKVMQTGKPLIVEDITKHPDLAVYSKGIYKTGSFLSIPLYATVDHQEKRVLGMLNLSDKTTDESFRSNDLKLLNALTAQASIAITNAQALKELRNSKEELKKTLGELINTYENLEKRAVIIDQINKISLGINATLDLEKLIDKICNYATNMTHAEEATVYYKESSPPESQGPEEAAAVESVDPSGSVESLFSFSEILEKGRVLFIHQPDRTLYLPLKNGRKVTIRNLLAVPFFHQEKAIGVIAIANKLSADRFSKEDEENIRTLSNQAAIAVENAKLIADQKVLFLDTIITLAAAVDAKDPYTHNHSKSVSIYSKAIGEELGLSEHEMNILELAAILHDIGKIATPESILNKPDKLTYDEFCIMKEHPVSGIKIVENIKQMEEIIPAMRYHHERYDGKGYPDGIKGEEIPLLARVIAVADTYDAITSDRPYRKGPGHEFAIEELKKCSGAQFSPEVVEAFLRSWVCKEKSSELVEQS